MPEVPEQQLAPCDHPHMGIAHEARKAIGCEGIYADGDCFSVLPEPNDYDMCDRCHLVWRLTCFEDEANDWWKAAIA